MKNQRSEGLAHHVRYVIDAMVCVGGWRIYKIKET
jgi:hypothetical protein